MKICILTHTFPRYKNDSNAAFMHPLALGLKKAGNDVTVLTPYNSILKVNDFPYKVISYRYIWPRFLHLLGYSRTLKAGMELKKELYFLSPFFFLFGIIALCKLCLKEKFDIISSHWILPNGFIAFIASKITKTPYTVTLAGSDVYISQKNYFFTKMAILAANNASYILADSPKFLSEISDLGAKVKRSCIVPYPVSVEKFKPNNNERIKLRNKLGFKEKDIVIFGLGRLIHKKGFKYAIEAFSFLKKENKNIYLVIGGDGDLKKELENLCLELDVRNKVKFIGNIERNKVSFYYNMCDIFIMPSITDAQGNIDDQPVALIEAMSCGKPIVATKFPGISLTVKDEENGFLFPEKDVNSLRKALSKLIRSDKLRKKMGDKSRRIAFGNLCINRIGQKYTRIFLDTLKSNK